MLVFCCDGFLKLSSHDGYFMPFHASLPDTLPVVLIADFGVVCTHLRHQMSTQRGVGITGWCVDALAWLYHIF